MCSKQLQKYLSAIFQEDWATNMLDATSKIPTGLLAGNLIDLGNFDECVAIENTTIIDEKSTPILGKYCLLTIPISLIIPKNYHKGLTRIKKPSEGPEGRVLNVVSAVPSFTLALCLPDACTEDYFNNLINRNPKLKGVSVGSCQTKYNNTELKPGDIGFIVFFTLICGIMLASTIYDIIIQRMEKRTAHPLLIAFSIFTNGKKMTTVSKNASQLQCVNGIRFLSMVWVIFGHSYYAFMFSPAINSVHILEWAYYKMASTLLGASVSVDSFFVLGGLVMVYVYMKSVEKKIKFNIIMYYIHRYIRLTPSLAIMMVAHITVLPYLGSGPYWPSVTQPLRDSCSKWWWSVLLYVQNYVNQEEFCIGQTWYLSVDMQLFIVSPLVLLPLKRWPRQTILALWVALILGIISPFVVAYIYEISGNFVASSNPHFMKDYYTNTYVRFGPWVVGLLLGYYVYNKDRNTKINKLLKNKYINLLGWTICIGTLLAVVYGTHNMLRHAYDRVESSIYIGFHRVAWGIALSYIIYACVTGYGGIVNWFLSLPVFQVLSKLSYSMYLIHLSLQFMMIGQLRVPRYFDDYNVINIFWGNLGITMSLSLFWTLAFESPIIAIEKLIFKN